MTDPTRKRLLELDARGKPAFTYKRAAETDVAATIARLRRQMKEEQAAKPVNVKSIKTARKA